MTSKNESNPSELEPNGSDKSVEQSNVENTQKHVSVPKPGEDKEKTQQLIYGTIPSRLRSPNITPKVVGQWKPYLWRAILEARQISGTTLDVHKFVSEWNTRNKPRIPELELVDEIDASLKRWGIRFYRYESTYERFQREKRDTTP